VSQPSGKLLPNFDHGGQANIDDSQLSDVKLTAIAIWKRGEVFPLAGRSLCMPLDIATY